jgi:hypothetical protein
VAEQSETSPDRHPKSFAALEILFATPNLGTSAKLVANYLWMRADRENGKAWPSQALMARACELSERQIRNLLKQLESAGAITIIRGAGRTVNRYQVHLDRLADRKPISAQTEPLSGSRLPVTSETHFRADRKLVAGHAGNGFPTEQQRNSAKKQSVNRGRTDSNSRLWSELSDADLNRAVKHDDPTFLERLWQEALQLPDPVPASDHNRFQFYATAHYVVTAPRSEVRKPVAVFVAKVRDRDWRTGSQQSEEWARQAIRKVDRPSDIDAPEPEIPLKTSTPSTVARCGTCSATPSDNFGCSVCRPLTAPRRGLSTAELARIKPKPADCS